MIPIVVSNTWAERERLIGYSKENGFSETIGRLKEIEADTDLACIVTCSFKMLIQLFSQFNIVNDNGLGSYILINNKGELYQMAGRKITSVHKAWLLILRNLSEDIDELFRFGAEECGYDVVFLKNVLIFLTFIDIYEDSEQFEKFIKN